MKAALVHALDQPPVYGDFPEPVASAGAVVVEVVAAAISHITRSRASGTHYSAGAALPFIPGIDGVGRLGDGSMVYFVMPEAPFGAMAERTLVAPQHCISVPDGLDPVTAAAIANAGMSSWAACVERARLRPGETVLINGATGAAGRLAVQIARHLGAGKVIATGRNPEGLRAAAELGADVTIPLHEDDDTLQKAFHQHFEAGIDVVIDYLWGRSAELALIAAARAGEDARPIRFIQVGAAGGAEIVLPGAVLRSSAIELKGSGIGSLGLDRLLACTGQMLQAAAQADFRLATQPVPLAEITQAWSRHEAGRRLVVLMATQ
jgi:NADPH:quinone reductase-like Zn-dependent oxidoreductase